MADCVADNAAAGLTVLLDGPVGAGKTTLARRVIQTLQAREGKAEEVPSPTFTIVQTYAAGSLEIWHADLYRLTSTSELFELGLEAAFDQSFCLVEWPDRLGDTTPPALRVTLSYGGSDTSRNCRLEADGPLAQNLQTTLLKAFAP